MDDCGFTSFSTPFHSYQDNGCVIMEGCLQWNPVYSWKDPHLKRGSNPEPLDQRASASPTEQPGLLTC